MLLKNIGLEISVTSPVCDEKAGADEPPIDQAMRFAREKAFSVSKKGNITIGADTIVVIDNKILGKPVDKDDAVRMLSLLSGNMHRVVTGYCIINRDFKLILNHAVSEVTFRHLTKDEILAYIKTGEPMDKAGAYGIQFLGSAFVSTVSGSYTNVVGLPLCRIVDELLQMKAIEPNV